MEIAKFLCGHEFVDRVAKIEDAREALSVEAKQIRKFEPSCFLAESEISGISQEGSRTVRIGYRSAPKFDLLNLPVLSSVVIVVADDDTPSALEQLRFLKEGQSKRLVIANDLSWLVEVLSEGVADRGLLASDPELMMNLRVAINKLQRDYRSARFERVATLIGYNSLEFLKSARIRNMLLERVIHSEGILLVCDPPGFVHLKNGSDAEFVLVCDQSYIQFLHECQAEQKEGEYPGLSPWYCFLLSRLKDVIEAVRPVPGDERWYFARLQTSGFWHRQDAVD